MGGYGVTVVMASFAGIRATAGVAAGVVSSDMMSPITEADIAGEVGV